MDIQVYVDALKYKLQQGSASRDRRYADSYLKHILIASRKTLLKRRVDKGETLPDSFYKLQCVDFIDSPYHNCNCATGTCMYKVSIKNLPDIISSKKKMQIDVMNLNGFYIDELDVTQTTYRNKYAINQKESNKTLTWHIQNRKIVLMNGSKIVKLLIRYLPAGTLEENFSMENCGGNTGIVCYQGDDYIFYDDDITLYDLAEKMILGRPSDETNNQVDETTSVQTK